MAITLWRSKTGQDDSDKTLLKVISITCESAVLPLTTLLAAVIIYQAHPVSFFLFLESTSSHPRFQRKGEDNVVLLLVLVTGKLYTLVLLRTLNSRNELRQRFRSHSLGRNSLGNWQWDKSGKSTTTSTLDPAMPGERVSDVRTGSRIPSLVSESIAPNEDVLTVSGRTQEVQFGTPSMDAREKGFNTTGHPSMLKAA